MRKLIVLLIAFTAGLKQTAAAINQARGADELTTNLNKQISLRTRRKNECQ